MARILIIMISLLFVPGATLAEMFKWIDDAGNVHYGDTPPVKNQAEKMQPPPAADEKEAQRIQQRTQKILQNQQQLDASRARDVQAAKKNNSSKISIEKRCKRAQVELVFFKKRGKHSILDEEGNLTRIKSTERKQKISELESFISEYCG